MYQYLSTLWASKPINITWNVLSQSRPQLNSVVPILMCFFFNSSRSIAKLPALIDLFTVYWPDWIKPTFYCLLRLNKERIKHVQVKLIMGLSTAWYQSSNISLKEMFLFNGFQPQFIDIVEKHQFIKCSNAIWNEHCVMSTQDNNEQRFSPFQARIYFIGQVCTFSFRWMRTLMM